MSSLWDIYYQHWGKESYNVLKLRMDKKKSIKKTVHRIRSWCFRNDIDNPPWNGDEEIIYRLENMGVIDYDDSVRFRMIKELSTKLCPPFIPELEDEFAFKTLDVVGCALERSAGTPWYYPPPVEKTLLRNLGCGKNRSMEMYFAKGYDSDRIRNLNAILALP